MLTGSVSTVSPMEWAGVTFGGRERQGSCDLNDDRAGELVPTWRPARVLVLTGANASGLRKQVLRKAFATSNAVSDTGNVLSRPLSRADIKSSRSFVLGIKVLNSCFSFPVFCLFF